jgi:hypothetical protein
LLLVSDMSRRILFFRHTLAELDEMVESCSEAVAEAKKREACGSGPPSGQDSSAGAAEESTLRQSSDDTAVESQAVTQIAAGRP